MSDKINNLQPPAGAFPPNFGPGLSMYQLMQATGVIGPDGSPQIAVVGMTQDLGAAIAWLNEKGGRAVALNYVMAINNAPLHSPIIGAKN